MSGVAQERASRTPPESVLGLNKENALGRVDVVIGLDGQPSIAGYFFQPDGDDPMADEIELFQRAADALLKHIEDLRSYAMHATDATGYAEWYGHISEREESDFRQLEGQLGVPAAWALLVLDIYVDDRRLEKIVGYGVRRADIDSDATRAAIVRGSVEVTKIVDVQVDAVDYDDEEPPARLTPVLDWIEGLLEHGPRFHLRLKHIPLDLRRYSFEIVETASIVDQLA